jgi:hypothetical protein
MQKKRESPSCIGCDKKHVLGQFTLINQQKTLQFVYRSSTAEVWTTKGACHFRFQEGSPMLGLLKVTVA